MSLRKIPFHLLIAAFAVAIPFGCAKHKSDRAAAATHGKFFAITAEKTAFYRYGPLQGNGPDRELTKDTLVTLIRRSFGYSKVRLTDGQEGFVANEDIQVAPESLVVKNTEVASAPAPLPESPVTLPQSPEFEPTPIPDLISPH
jgi:hypothetical protein